MNIQEDQFYIDILDAYFKSIYNVKLIRLFTKLDTAADSFIINQPYGEVLGFAEAELTNVMNFVNVDNEQEFQLEDNEFLGLVGSGIKNMNPSLIQLELKDNNNGATQVDMKAYCGEGLIKQKTNQKAMNIIESYLTGNNMDEL